MPNPYSHKSLVHFWKTAVAELEPGSVMPVPARRFLLENGDAVATAGSCFAQEIGKYLPAIPE